MQNYDENREEYSRRDAFETERRIVEEVRTIENNADSYGEEVEIVARRAILAEPDELGTRGNGYEYEYKLSDGRVLSNDECWELANAHKIKNVIGSHNHGRKYIRSVGDGNPHNNLSDLPTF